MACNSFAGGLALLAASSILCGGAAAQTRLRYDNGWLFDGGAAYVPLAADRGCFAREGLEVAMDRGFGSGDTLGKIAAGAYDFGEADFNNMAQFDVAHPESRLIAVFVISDGAPGTIAMLKSSGIAAPKDLVGKRIGDAVGETVRVLFPAFAKANGFDPGAVTWINTSFNLREQLLVQGRADAIAGDMWTLQRGLTALHVKDDDMRYFRYADFAPELFAGSLVVRADWAASHGEAVKAFVRCTAEGVKAEIADPASALAAAKKRNSLFDEPTERTALEYASSLIMTKNVRENGLSFVTPERMERVLKQISQALGVRQPASDEVWNDKYLPPRSTLKVD